MESPNIRSPCLYGRNAMRGVWAHSCGYCGRKTKFLSDFFFTSFGVGYSYARISHEENPVGAMLGSHERVMVRTKFGPRNKASGKFRCLNRNVTAGIIATPVFRGALGVFFGRCAQDLRPVHFCFFLPIGFRFRTICDRFKAWVTLSVDASFSTWSTVRDR